MGFGSYDESEQQAQDVSTEAESEAVNVHENDYEGEMTFDTNASTGDLLDKLGEIKTVEDEE